MHDDFFDTIDRRLKADEFGQKQFTEITALHEVRNGQVVAIDGNTPRRRYSDAAIHMVIAWDNDFHIRLGQVTTHAETPEAKAPHATPDESNIEIVRPACQYRGVWKSFFLICQGIGRVVRFH